MWFFLYLLLAELAFRAFEYAQKHYTDDSPVSPEQALPLAPKVHKHEATTAPEAREPEGVLEAPEDTSSDQDGTANWVVTEVGPLRVNYETWKKYK